MSLKTKKQNLNKYCMDFITFNPVFSFSIVISNYTVTNNTAWNDWYFIFVILLVFLFSDIQSIRAKSQKLYHYLMFVT